MIIRDWQTRGAPVQYCTSPLDDSQILPSRIWGPGVSLPGASMSELGRSIHPRCHSNGNRHHCGATKPGRQYLSGGFPVGQKEITINARMLGSPPHIKQKMYGGAGGACERMDRSKRKEILSLGVVCAGRKRFVEGDFGSKSTRGFSCLEYSEGEGEENVCPYAAPIAPKSTIGFPDAGCRRGHSGVHPESD